MALTMPRVLASLAARVRTFFSSLSCFACSSPSAFLTPVSSARAVSSWVESALQYCTICKYLFWPVLPLLAMEATEARKKASNSLSSPRLSTISLNCGSQGVRAQGSCGGVWLKKGCRWGEKGPERHGAYLGRAGAVFDELHLLLEGQLGLCTATHARQWW